MAMPMKKLIIVIAIALQVTSASAADATLRLSCEGMVTVTDKVTVTDNTKMDADAKPEPVIANVIVDFTDRTVQGLFYLQSSLDYQVKVTAMNKATVTFGGISDSKAISGKIDRVTGDMSATSVSTEPEGLILLKTYALKCRPVQRMF